MAGRSAQHVYAFSCGLRHPITLWLSLPSFISTNEPILIHKTRLLWNNHNLRFCGSCARMFQTDIVWKLFNTVSIQIVVSKILYVSHSYQIKYYYIICKVRKCSLCLDFITLYSTLFVDTWWNSISVEYFFIFYNCTISQSINFKLINCETVQVLNK